MIDLHIVSTSEKKGREFSSTLLSYATADQLWQGGQTSTDVTRPVWLMLGGAVSEVKYFVANLRLGKRAESNSVSKWNSLRIECLKSANYRYYTQVLPDGVCTTLFLPEIFDLDPGMVDPEKVSFVLLPAQDWVTDLDESVKNHLLAIGVEQPQDIIRLYKLFAIWLDRRTRCPLIPDPRFWAQILLGALTEGLATTTTEAHSYRSREWGQNPRLGFKTYGLETVGIHEGLAFYASHEELEGFLAKHVTLFRETVNG